MAFESNVGKGRFAHTDLVERGTQTDGRLSVWAATTNYTGSFSAVASDDCLKALEAARL